MQITRIYDNQISNGFLDADGSNASGVLVNSHSPRGHLFFGGSPMELIRRLPSKKDKKGKTRQYGLFICSYCNQKVEKVIENGSTNKSCGCARYKLSGKSNKIHGEGKTRLYKVWLDMKQRCANSNNSCYQYYGEKGITVCTEWLEYIVFRDWALANGYKSNLTIDRKDNNGNYESDNCRFITQKENNRNQNKTILSMEIAEEIRSKYIPWKYSMYKLAKEYNVTQACIFNVLKGKSWV